jgi:REP element-mobilizing transposase RayT
MDEEKYKGIYRIPPARWRDWDYEANAAYYVTVCTAHRERFFGEIVAGGAVQTPAAPQMKLSPVGETVQTEWLKTPALRPDMNIILGEYVVMPNHFHGIIVIGENQYNAPAVPVPAVAAAVETQCIASLQFQIRRRAALPVRPNLHTGEKIFSYGRK